MKTHMHLQTKRIPCQSHWSLNFWCCYFTITKLFRFSRLTSKLIKSHTHKKVLFIIISLDLAKVNKTTLQVIYIRIYIFEFLPQVPQIMSGRHQFQHSESLYMIHCSVIYSRTCTLSFHGGSWVFHYFLKRDLDDTDLSHIHRHYI